MLINLWGVVSHTALAAYHSAGSILTGTTAAGNILIGTISALRGDVRGAITSAVELIATGADHASHSGQATSHAIQAANSAIWLVVDIGNGLFWLYQRTTGPKHPAPIPGQLALPAPAVISEAAQPDALEAIEACKAITHAQALESAKTALPEDIEDTWVLIDTRDLVPQNVPS